MKKIRQLMKNFALIQHFLQWRQRRQRFQFAYSYYEPHLNSIHLWLKQSRETTNFTYDLQDINKKYLASLIAVILGTGIETILGYFDELENDQALREHIARMTENDPHRAVADLEGHFGRRIGWYALARTIKPKVIVETGVEKGLGSCVLTKALMANAAEGFPGVYYGTDIDSEAGYLFAEPYTRYGKILYGDSIASLQAMTDAIDLFINDSDHSMEYEAREYETVRPKLSENAFVLGDNSHVTDKLFEFAQETGRSFVFFGEKPKNHWYPGAGIGIAFSKRL